ncbi:cyanobactin maturation protease, PatA/PatG family [Rivularia sp. PCC 7116]|uniref:PatA/PatG family cyanobactin maturation protease n=1 Tax=Rivularia sp. PCC 7116 TaxID=373994 RepID=UPI00029ED55D|nr:PatA/PatG family cyanobactin maturation protease [Rivularia sp. PCC 7116]AFY58680.1 cyanobactin maturation protease, PatA/PatG family [Rivularia sp. PCC 7116]
MLDNGNLELGTLAIAESMVEGASLNLLEPDWNQAIFKLSRFAYQRQYDGAMVLESPLSKFRVRLLDWRANALLAVLTQPRSVEELNIFPDLSPETIQQFVNLLCSAQFLAVEPEPLSLQVWEFHNLLFHSRSRSGSHDYPTSHMEQFIEKLPQFPVVKPPMSGKIVSLPRPNLQVVMQGDLTLTEAIETRKSIRDYDDDHPITLEQLSELLYRTARVKEIYKVEKSEDVEYDFGELSNRPYPGGGSLYELEIYPVVHRCEGLDSGLYHYDPLNHQLEQLCPDNADVNVSLLLDNAHRISGEHAIPQVLLVITARFGRMFWKYSSVAYAVVLKHVGVLYQNLYLVANSMGLAPCALGNGDSERFAQATGLDYIEESSVGEFILGSLPNPDALISASMIESVEGAGGAGGEEIEPAVMASTADITPSTLTILHPHDLDNRIPGLINLRNQTLGDSQITIVILDSNPDHNLSCFEGANISKVFPYWHEAVEPIPPEAYATYREIENSGLKGDEKREKIKTVLSETVVNRITGDNHACHITSTIVGQENTPAPGIAPNCRVINIPINSPGDKEEFISVLNLARAFELALELGANIIHCAACRPTQTGEAQNLLTQAVKKCQDNNILIVAPAGNNKGECWCIPAVLPGTLAVGAMKDEGKPYKFSNWGGNYQIDGILVPGENILGAQPATEEPIRLKGTSMAAPVMTGICGLLMSLQLQQGKPIDAEAVRAALLNTAIPCNPDDVEEPERCLRGKLNLPQTIDLLFGQPSVKISFTGDTVSRIENQGYFVKGAGEAGGEINTNLNTNLNSNLQDNLQDISIPDSIPVSISNSEELVTASGTVESQSNQVTQSTAYSGHVYALGTLSYDFGGEARRDSFKQLMGAVDNGSGIMVPANPYDTRQMVDYLDQNPDEARSLIWTLNVDLTPVYAIEPKGGFAAEVYEILLLMLNGQLESEDSDEFIERLSIPALRTNRTVELFSGEVVPVITVRDVRGMYGWKVNTLVNAALGTVTAEVDEEQMRGCLTSFLNRVYYDLRNLGQTSRDRALNFAATNTFQAASTFAEAIATGRELDSIEVEKSPYCRLNSDCWDVKLKFFDPENSHRSHKVFRFTIDVAERLPVTLGEVKSWSVPGRRE